MAKVTTIGGTCRYATSTPFTAPMIAPTTHPAAVGVQTPPGAPSLATTPATTPATANTDPTEMSISPARTTSVAPSATTKTGILARNMSLRFSVEKYAGAASASTTASTAMAIATDTSLP